MKSKHIIPIIFIFVPIIEIILFIEIGGYIGTFVTITLIFLSAIIGFYLIKKGSINYFLEIRNKLAQGIKPEIEILSGMIFFFAGIMLIIPGFFTDLIGTMLLIRPLRDTLLKKYLQKYASEASRDSKKKSIIDVDHTSDND